MGAPRRLWRSSTRRVSLALAPRILSALLQLLAWTVRVRFVNRGALDERWARGERLILAFWHSRVALLPLQSGDRKVCIMNSQHRDGEIASRTLERWGIRAVRGSATRGGVGAFLRLVAAYREGFDLAIVPDGPRGPRCPAKVGVVYLAKATGAPVFRVSYAAGWRRGRGRWDRCAGPVALARVV